MDARHADKLLGEQWYWLSNQLDAFNFSQHADHTN